MLLRVKLFDRVGGFVVGQVARLRVDLVKGELFLLLKFDRTGLVFNQPLFLLLDELSLLSKLGLQGFNRLLVHFTLQFKLISLLLLFACDLVFFLFDFVLEDLLFIHHLEHALLGNST